MDVLCCFAVDYVFGNCQIPKCQAQSVKIRLSVYTFSHPQTARLQPYASRLRLVEHHKITKKQELYQIFTCFSVHALSLSFLALPQITKETLGNIKDYSYLCPKLKSHFKFGRVVYISLKNSALYGIVGRASLCLPVMT